ncbi:hypothetical protein B0I72DRAFT_138764 [Yarrowia lipolytica]|uniref:Uncharacterized protein n=1 Tax=Yarrowia lipolytica TaxID=4952 RepID=A0A371CBI3_YARLL|nr:hypothetical protein BKA91DRAFT_134810 [Yarrowia lipolytica]KAE8174524.1 hypothetical protein BKA90DRAFT_134100 [Yarrowia lipolytica]RDW27658.1 hypothetical protein B0I71DRAFT_128721 [Yarrowia lipolytica]RDW32019.1 hypothetical protein B0I72DRAFT_138764 [Yarrowia lipolytica]RDW39558.1 hypothetical protein B0I73DRAFT_131734 [Yarrowia lipolytica]
MLRFVCVCRCFVVGCGSHHTLPILDSLEHEGKLVAGQMGHQSHRRGFARLPNVELHVVCHNLILFVSPGHVA